jgi:peptide deformylase
MGHPVLTRRAEPLDPGVITSSPVQRLIDDMIETMREEPGVGLAAPQVHESIRLFVMEPGRSEEMEGGDLEVVVNPVLELVAGETQTLWEGCLSIPGIRGVTERSYAVDLVWLDREGSERRRTFRGFPAAVIQHEFDHLDGILFFERMPDLSRIAFEEEYLRYQVLDEVGEEAEEPSQGPPR